LIVGAAGFISLISWWRERVNRAAAEEGFRREREELKSRLEDREEALDQERRLRSRAEEAHQVEKNWRQELYGEIIGMYRERGALGYPSDVPSMVLRLARTLLEGEKGLLF
jgi:hypothetical protein